MQRILILQPVLCMQRFTICLGDDPSACVCSQWLSMAKENGKLPDY